MLDQVEAVLSVKLSVRWIMAVAIGAITITVLPLSQSKYLVKALIFPAALLLTPYIDDYLLMYHYAYMPEEIPPNSSLCDVSTNRNYLVV